MAALLAVYSPLTEWDINLTRAERAADILTNHSNYKWDDSMSAYVRSNLTNVMNESEITRLAGKTLNDLDSVEDKAMWLRVFDETHNPSMYRQALPDGRIGSHVLTRDGSLARRSWGPREQIEKAINILENGTDDNIRLALGRSHKVPNFYNDIAYPESWYPHLTADTHFGAAAQFRALSAQDRAIRDMFRSLGKASGGHVGTYPAYHQAGIAAAKALGLQPRELQSIVWETIRTMLHDKAALKDYFESIWSGRLGKLSHDQARDAGLERAGGVVKGGWQSDLETAIAGRSTYLEGDVRKSRLGQDTAESLDGRARGASSLPTSGLVESGLGTRLGSTRGFYGSNLRGRQARVLATYNPRTRIIELVRGRARAIDVYHEAGHWMHDLYKDHPSWGPILEKHYGKFDPATNREGLELFAKHLERYVAKGIAPSADMLPILEAMKRWLQQIYSQVKHGRTPDEVKNFLQHLDGPLTPEAEKVLREFDAFGSLPV